MKILKIILPIFMMLVSYHNIFSQSSQISGHVTNGTRSLPWARVRVQATSLFTIADFNGCFTLQNIPSADSLIISAWAEGFFNGETHAIAGDTSAVIILNPLYEHDNSSYQWLSPNSDSLKTDNCGNCHTTVLMDQWRHNAHANSATNPFFMAMYYGTDYTGESDAGVGYKSDFEYTRGNCATCHIPGAAANNPWGIDPREVTDVSKNGVFCDFCHKIYNVKPSTGQGTTGVLSIELLRPPEGKQIFFGPFDDIHEPDAYSPIIHKSEFCAPCHTGKFWGTPAYQSFPEWQASPYPAKGINCQHCHMAPDSVSTHFVFPEKGGLERNPLTIPSHSQPGSRDPVILSNAVTLDVSAEQLNDSIKVMVTIYNDKTGHHVPTGRPSRNMLLLVTPVTNDDDTLHFIGGEKVPYWSGTGKYSDGNYANYPGKGFAKILEDFNGYSPAPSWRPTKILSDNRIAALATDTSYYYFKTPNFAKQVVVNVRLIYRRFFKKWMEEKNFDIPDIEMENETTVLTVTTISMDEQPAKMPVGFWLEQNFPNPFNQSTTIRFKLAHPSFTVFKIYDIKGRIISTLVESRLEAGIHQISFDAVHLSSGIYFYQIQAGSWKAMKKLLVLR